MSNRLSASFQTLSEAVHAGKTADRPRGFSVYRVEVEGDLSPRYDYVPWGCREPRHEGKVFRVEELQSWQYSSQHGFQVVRGAELCPFAERADEVEKLTEHHGDAQPHDDAYRTALLAGMRARSKQPDLTDEELAMVATLYCASLTSEEEIKSVSSGFLKGSHFVQ